MGKIKLILNLIWKGLLSLVAIFLGYRIYQHFKKSKEMKAEISNPNKEQDLSEAQRIHKDIEELRRDI